MGFTHLHLHTGYSLLDGACKPKELVARAKELGMKSLAITDHGVMYGVIDFFSECVKQGVKPIIGCEIYLVDGNITDRKPGEMRYHLILLCKDKIGYKNLTKLVSRSFIDGFYYKPRVDFETLEKYSEGLICLSACVQGAVAKNLIDGNYKAAKNVAMRFQDIYGKDNFYIEIQNHGLANELKIHTDLIRLAKDIGAKVVATNDVHYLLKEDEEAHDCLICLQTGYKVADENRMSYRGGNYYLKSEEEMLNDFKFIPEAVENTEEVAAKCNCHLEFTKNSYATFKDKAKDKEILKLVDECEYHVPTFTVPDGMTNVEYIKKLAEDGLKKKLKTVPKEIEDRLNYELKMIIDMGFVDYFLLVWDYIHYAKTHDIPVGPGRGSGVGSLVAYALSITDVDPLQHKLFFERFLNPERVSMPDIDTDFEVEKRGDVIDYVRERYGNENVAQIVTFTTMGARGTIRDVGRVLGAEVKKCDTIAKLVPQMMPNDDDFSIKGMSDFEKLLKGEIGGFRSQDQAKIEDFRITYETDDEAKHIIDIASRLEGLPRQASTHASGVLISPEPIYNFLPLARSKDESIVTQFTMNELESIGMLKMDFLGLRNLSAIDDCVKAIKEKYDKNFDIHNIPLDDKNVFDMISRGDTLGIFQLESNGMTSFMKRLGPTCIDDLIAGISLYRPGPMDFIPKYIDGKHQKEIVYDTPLLKNVLESTYGCIVYQEQVMEIFRELAGFSLGRADEVRRAMSKKKAEKLMQEENNFIHGNEELGIDGCIKRGISEKVAKKIFDDMKTFAQYAFNKSHAAAYATLAYQTAYLKYYYKIEFYNSIFNSVINDRNLLGEYVANIQADGIDLLRIDINKSKETCRVEDEHSIRLGLVVLNGFGIGVASKIVEDREKNGPYTSMYDFAMRNIDPDGKKILNDKVVENLIKTGAFDDFPGNRNQKWHMYPMMAKEIDGKSKRRKKKLDGERTFLDLYEKIENGKEKEDIYKDKDEEFLKNLDDVQEYSDAFKLKWEKDTTGIYISGHPLNAYKDYIDDNTNVKIADFFPSDDTDQDYLLYDGKRVRLVCMLDECKKMLTKKGDHYARCVLSDQTGIIDAVIFPKVYKTSVNLLEKNEILQVDGRVQYEPDRNLTNILVDRVSKPLDGYKKGDNNKKVYLRFQDIPEFKSKIDNVSEELVKFQGPNEVILYIADGKKSRKYPKGGVLIDDELIKNLTKILGENNVKVQ